MIVVDASAVLEAPLLTRDKRLAASPGHHARIYIDASSPQCRRASADL
jgi:hypothetical protein